MGKLLPHRTPLGERAISTPGHRQAGPQPKQVQNRSDPVHNHIAAR
jgi:hypothetical protein